MYNRIHLISFDSKKEERKSCTIFRFDSYKIEIGVLDDMWYDEITDFDIISWSTINRKYQPNKSTDLNEIIPILRKKTRNQLDKHGFEIINQKTFEYDNKKLKDKIELNLLFDVINEQEKNERKNGPFSEESDSLRKSRDNWVEFLIKDRGL